MDMAKMKAAEYRRAQEIRSAMREEAKRAREAEEVERREAIAAKGLERDLVDRPTYTRDTRRRTTLNVSYVLDYSDDNDDGRVPAFVFDDRHGDTVNDEIQSDKQEQSTKPEPELSDEDYTEGYDQGENADDDESFEHHATLWDGAAESEDEGSEEEDVAMLDID
jgi:hypothetical protein